MSAFRLPDLPSLAIDGVLKFFNHSELLELSFCSEKWRRIVSNFTRHTQYKWHCEIDVTLSSEWFEIKNCYEPNFTWNFFLCEFKSKKTRPMSRTERIEIHKLSRTYNRPGFRSFGDRSRKLMRVLTYYEKVLNCRVDWFKVGGSEVRDMPEFWKLKCLQSAKRIHSGGGAVSSEKMTRILDLISPTQTSAFIHVYPIDRHYRYGKPLNGSCVWFGQGERINKNQLLMMNFEKIRIEKSQLTNEDYQAFIRKWLNSDSTKLVYLNVVYNKMDHFMKLSQEKITEGLPTKEGREKRYCPKSFLEYEDYPLPSGEHFKNGIDIRRSDGMLATFMVYWKKSTDGNIPARVVHFVVWHENEKYPGNPNVQE